MEIACAKGLMWHLKEKRIQWEQRQKRIDPITAANSSVVLPFFAPSLSLTHLDNISRGSFLWVHAYDNHDMSQCGGFISANIGILTESKDSKSDEYTKTVWLFQSGERRLERMCCDNDGDVNSGSTSNRFNIVVNVLRWTMAHYVLQHIYV